MSSKSDEKLKNIMKKVEKMKKITQKTDKARNTHMGQTMTRKQVKKTSF